MWTISCYFCPDIRDVKHTPINPGQCQILLWVFQKMIFMTVFIYLFIKNFLTFIYFWDRERASVNGGGSGREGDTESETASRLWEVSTEPDAGLELTDREIMTWAKVGRLTDWATQAPLMTVFKGPVLPSLHLCNFISCQKIKGHGIWDRYQMNVKQRVARKAVKTLLLA